jgi:hypothetical protein
MKKYFAILIALLMIFVSVAAKPAAAISAPEFPFCLNPQGTVVASYKEGSHGIVAYSTAFSGSDVVYKLANSNVMQCFCDTSGNGIQTNWLKAAGASEDDIKSMQAQNWTYVPNGSAWGLEDVPYFAKNSFFNCKPSIGGGSGGDGRSSGSASSASSSSSNDLAGKVLGLAFTGSSEYIFNLWLYGLVATAFGVWMKRFITRKKSSQ